MRIALLSDPDNFHTRKWAGALLQAGGDVQVFSYDSCSHSDFRATRLPLPPVCNGKLSYLAYLFGGSILREALQSQNIDVVVALNVTPFGVWARQSGHHPWVAVAMGADILEFLPPKLLPASLQQRSWDNVEGSSQAWVAWKTRFSRPFYRMQVRRALQSADAITADNQVLVDAILAGFLVDPAKVSLNRWGIVPEMLEIQPDTTAELRSRLGIPKDSKVILSPRGLKAVYHADVIVEGYLKLLEAGRKNCCLVMLGAGYPVSDKIRERKKEVEKAGGKLILVEELLSAEDMGQLWHLTDVFISAPAYDGYSSALAEGRYVGAVPVVNAIPGNLELIRHGENGWICTPFSPAQLALDLQEILSDLPQIKGKFAAKNRAWIDAHGLIAPNAKKFLALLEGLSQH